MNGPIENHSLQWNFSIADTLGTAENVLIGVLISGVVLYKINLAGMGL